MSASAERARRWEGRAGRGALGRRRKLTRRAKERRARVAARDGRHGRHHQVLDEGAHDRDAELALGVRHDIRHGGLDARDRLDARGVEAGRVHRLLPLDVLELVHLFVVDQDVHVVLRQLILVLRHDHRRAHAVELADLRRALQHLHAVLVVGHLVRHRREHTEAAEAARLEARGAALEVGDGALAAVGVPTSGALVGRERAAARSRGFEAAARA